MSLLDRHRHELAAAALEGRAGWHARLAALLLLAVMAAGLWQVGAALLRIDTAALPSTRDDFREGRTTAALEKAIDHALPLRESLIAVANAARWTLTGGTGERVRAGRADWLFLTDEVRHEPAAAERQAGRIALLAAADAHLRARGVRLLVALVPDKTRVQAAEWGQPLAAGHAARYARALADLRAAGVATVDLHAPLAAAAASGPVYYRSDTHWNAAGARIAAQAIAEAAGRLGLDLPPTPYRTEAGGEPAERVGDLIGLMGLSGMPAALRPPADREAPPITQAAGPARAGEAGDLFADETVPVVLVGTSYSRRGNFHGFLQEALAATVLNAARDGGGFLQSATDYFGDAAFRETPPALVIWEVPERFLPAAPEGEADWIARLFGG